MTIKEFDRSLRELTAGAGWREAHEAWARQCEAYGESIDEYAIGSLSTIADLIKNPDPKAKALGLYDVDGNCHAMCHANVANLPGYQHPVLRIRHLLLSPDYDFGMLGPVEYANALTTMFAGVVSMAFKEMPAKHVKFHLRSPADVTFFGAVAKALASVPTFTSVQMKGAWLYLDLAEMPTPGSGATQ